MKRAIDEEPVVEVEADISPPAAPAAAAGIFGDQIKGAHRFAELLVRHGVQRGLIGPREIDRLWDRHLLNSAVIGDQIADGARVIDVGSGAGLPGIPLALARPDLEIVLVEPMARRVDWLTEVLDELELPVRVLRGRAEERAVRDELAAADVVTARAVAPLSRLADWCLPLVRPGGRLIALKGASAEEEIARDQAAITRSGGGRPVLAECGAGVLETPTRVVLIDRLAPPATARRRNGASGKRRSAR